MHEPAEQRQLDDRELGLREADEARRDVRSARGTWWIAATSPSAAVSSPAVPAQQTTGVITYPERVT